MLAGFRDFLMRGNVVDLAVGIVVGAAFGKIVEKLVGDILTPLIAAIFKAPDFSALAITLNGSKILYGDFLNGLISFVIAAAAVYFFVVVPMNKMLARFKKTDVAEATGPTEDQKLLIEIRDVLKARG